MKAKQRVPARLAGNRRFGFEQRQLRSNFVAARLDETENHAQQPGNLGNVGREPSGAAGDHPAHMRLTSFDSYDAGTLTDRHDGADDMDGWSRKRTPKRKPSWTRCCQCIVLD